MNLSLLDQEERFNLALHAIQQQQHHEAILLLKHALDHDPSDARLAYLLGTEYAQIGLFERALALLEQAVQQDPTLEMAQFQLGLLNLTLGRVEQALKTWRDSTWQMTSEPLRLFSTGLQHLARDEFSACREMLRQGIAINHTLPALNEDMQKILDRLPETAPTLSGSCIDERPAPKDEANHSGSIFIRAYSASDSDTFH